jgi:hypothetical protein
VDYTKFLGKKERVVLAYLGGAHVFDHDRRLRVDGARPALGFHSFEVSGRNARALEAAEAPALDGLPKARGHLVEGWLVSSAAPGAVVHDARARVGLGLDRLALCPEDEPAPLAIVRARRWHSGELLFESLDFDGEVEEEARLRLERRAPLRDLKGVAATLRAAYGIALTLAVGRRVGVPIAAREAAGHAAEIADEGEPAARALFARLQEERAAALVRVERERVAGDRAAWEAAVEAGRPMAQLRGRGGVRLRGVVPTLENAEARAESALDGARARMLAARRRGAGQLEVAYEFMGERFVSIVDALTLQVIDSGVCLAGEDALVTLDSLPGVIREAIDTDRLVITRR